MEGTDFINVAAELAYGSTEAHWRSSISRAYYAVFHKAKDALSDKSVYVPRNKNSHKYIQEWLQRQNNRLLTKLGSDLSNLHSDRCRSDYDFNVDPINKNDAMLKLVMARALINDIEKSL